MDESSADAFVYAKASGMLAKSFVGTRAVKLFSVVSLEGLWELLFRSEMPSVSEHSPVQMIEKNAENQFLKGFTSLLNNYSKPQEFLIDLLLFYDHNDLKAIIAYLDSCGGYIPRPLGRKKGMYPTAIPYENEGYPERSVSGYRSFYWESRKGGSPI